MQTTNYIESDNCSICLDEFDPQKDRVYSHVGEAAFFHAKCLAIWMNRSPTCPICRKEVEQTTLVAEKTLVQNEIDNAFYYPKMISKTCFVIAMGSFAVTPLMNGSTITSTIGLACLATWPCRISLPSVVLS